MKWSHSNFLIRMKYEKILNCNGYLSYNINRGFVDNLFPGVFKSFKVLDVFFDGSNPVEVFIFKVFSYSSTGFFGSDQTLII